jgi:hypothetical protein
VIPPGVKRPGREADHSHPSSAEVKNGGSIPQLHHMSSVDSGYLVKDKVKVKVSMRLTVNQ